MTWLFIGLVVLVVAAVAVVAVGRGAGLSVAQPDRPEVSVPADRMLSGADLDALGLTVGLRGYRMDEVDDLLSRLATEIDERDRRLAELAPPPAEPAAGQATPGVPATEEAAPGPPVMEQPATQQPATVEAATPEPSELR